MTSQEVRDRFLAFFEKRGHKIIPSASLVPENDPTTLFTGSGMQPLVPYLLGQPHPQGKRLANSQKSFRSGDIEDVGDNRHTTFFEMLGNWSLGDYFKSEQLSWFFEFLTTEIGIPKDRLWVTCFSGDEKLNLPKDAEAAEIWKKLGLPETRILFYDAKKNWWSRSGTPENMPAGEPGGPDSEVFYEFTEIEHDKKFGEQCHPNCDCGRFLEIGNSVFMEYQKLSDGSFAKLPQQNVDFGGGLERITAVSENNSDIFQIDVFSELIKTLENLSSKKYDDENYTIAFRVVADHLRSAIFLIGDGITPSNTDQGYFVRRLVRRAIRYWDKLGIKEAGLATLVKPTIAYYQETYPDIYHKQEEIVVAVEQEEEKFRATLRQGLRQFEKMGKDSISGSEAFTLFSTYGFPLELTLELALEQGIDVDEAGFATEMKKHQNLSRAGAEQKFKGGLADTSEMTVRYHTATHLLHQALRDVLGKTVSQKGSNITSERLRFDFTHPQKMTPEEIAQVEKIINEKIAAALPVNKVVLPKDEAEESGALHFFGDKYSDTVSVYYVGDDLADAYSKEFCGGPHVNNTSELGKNFKITKEEAVAAGVRRIKAVLE